MLDRTLRALTDPTRRDILKLLREGSRTAGEIADRFPITGASVSHHLSILREARLVLAERQGRNVIYSLNSTVFQDFLDALVDHFEIGGRE